MSGTDSSIDAPAHDVATTTLFMPIGSARAQRVVAAVFVLMLMLPMAAQFAGWNNQVALLERHEPSAFPALPRTPGALQAWPQGVDRWLLDRTGLRSAMVFAGSFIEVNLLGQSTSRDVVLGRDGWLFHTGDRTFEQLHGTDIFTPQQLDRWINRMEQRRDWLAARGIAFLFVIVPNKERVYPEFLPASVGAVAPVSRLSQIERRLEERASSLPLLDLTRTLIAAKQDMQVFARRDTHWSGAGAFRAYQAIMQRLQPTLPALQPLRAEQMESIAFTYAARDLDLMRMLGLGWGGRSETLDYPLFRGTAPWKTRREDATVGGVPHMRLSSTRTEAPTALWLGDSFSDTLAVYLNATFRTVTLVPHRGLRFDKTLIESEQPDVVVFEVVERFLANELPAD